MSDLPTTNPSSKHSGIQPDMTVPGFAANRQHDNAPVTTRTIQGGQQQPTGNANPLGPDSSLANQLDDRATDVGPHESAQSSKHANTWQPSVNERRASQIGTMVGNFLIEEEIASGGMGTVFRAMQVKPVRREVALKMIRRGLDDDETLQRFHCERQALAMMDHPNIAKIYEADTTPFGNPYFAMEYCHGSPIRHFCQEHSLGINGRIKLIIQLAQAVESAHRLGVIHRDLKPDNVLVSMREGQPELKIIDFGIAKFSDQTWQGGTASTQTGQLVGTPAYMSPEQAEGGTIDARTDVFAMGAILFELLTGTTPLLPPDSDCETLGGIIQHVLSYEPVLVSQRWKSGEAKQRADMAVEMNLRPNQLRAKLQGDLAWVCLKATEKNRLDRYATSNDFAEDLQRILDHQPVSAAQSSLLYRAKKLFQRRRRSILVTATVSMLLALTGMFVGWNEYQRSQANTIRAAELKGTLRQTLDQAFEARKQAGFGGENAGQFFAETVAKAATADKTADELMHITNESDPVNAELTERLIELHRLIASDRIAARLVQNLDDAREQATQIGPDENDALGRQVGLIQLAQAFAEIGIDFGMTQPAAAAEILGKLPPYAQTNVVETLDFLLSESPIGAGIYLHLQGGELTIAELLEGGPAEKSDRLRVGDRVLKINELSLVDGLHSRPETLRSLAYEQLFGAPGETVRVTVLRDQFEPFSVHLTLAGEISHWTQAVLASLDPDPWRTELREAILTGDLVELKRLGQTIAADSAKGKPQTAFSLIQLASTQFLLERSNESIDYLRECQQANRDHFWANHYLGVALCNAHVPTRPEEGIRYLTAAVALRPDSLGARMNLASGYFYVGDLCGQLQELKAAQAIDPGFAPLKKQIAMLSSALNVAPDQRSEELPPIESTDGTESADTEGTDFGSHRFEKDSFEQFEARAREYATAGNRDAAMAELKRMSLRFANDPRLGRARGAVLLDLNDITTANIALAAAARTNPQDAATRFYHGVALQHAGQFKDALYEYRAAYAIQPNYLDAKKAADALASFIEELR